MGLFSNKHLLIKATREPVAAKVSLWEKSGLLENVDIKLKASLAFSYDNMASLLIDKNSGIDDVDSACFVFLRRVFVKRNKNNVISTEECEVMYDNMLEYNNVLSDNDWMNNHVNPYYRNRIDFQAEILAGMSESFNVNSFLRYVLIEDVNKDKVIKFKKFYK